MKNLTIFSNEVSIEHISAMDKQGTLWLSKILSKGQEKSQYYNISLQTSMKKKKCILNPSWKIGSPEQ